MHIIKMLGPLEESEALMSDLYEWFSKEFSDDAEAASLFYRISIEETVHANLIKYLHRLVSQNMKLFYETQMEVQMDIKEIYEGLARINSIRTSTSPSLKEAIRIAMELENGAVEQHYSVWIGAGIADISHIAKSLLKFDSSHFLEFERFAEKRGFVSPVRRSDHVIIELEVIENSKEAGEPAGQDAGGPSSVGPDMINRIEYLYEWHKVMGYYKILGIKDYADEAMIKHAFRVVSKELHPDNLHNLPDDLRRKSNEVFAYITTAHSILIDPEKRKKYDATRGSPRRH